jgi:ParE toxin of type II toxin-antitoxin system, parDE
MGKNKFSFAISSGAAGDTNKAAKWYDKKVDGLGYRFLTKLKVSLDKIHSAPSSFARYKKESDIRKYSVAGFPYKIYYIFRDEHIEILAIVHMSRSNNFIRRKLK